MALTWTTNRSHDGNSHGFDAANYLCASVCWYDDSERPGTRFWAAFIWNDRVPGRFATSEEAETAAEAAVSVSDRPRPRRGR